MQIILYGWLIIVSHPNQCCRSIWKYFQINTKYTRFHESVPNEEKLQTTKNNNSRSLFVLTIGSKNEKDAGYFLWATQIEVQIRKLDRLFRYLDSLLKFLKSLYRNLNLVDGIAMENSTIAPRIAFPKLYLILNLFNGYIYIFSCDSSSKHDNVRRSVGRSVGRMVGRSDGLQRVSKLHRMTCSEWN